MKRCIAYRRAGSCVHAWKPCTNLAVPHSQFCRRHADAMDGAVLGLLVTGFREDAKTRDNVRNRIRTGKAKRAVENPS